MTRHFDLIPGALDGLSVIEMHPLADARGHLMRLFCEDALAALGWKGKRHICQANHTLTRHKATIRGLHFQHPPHAETKIVTCLRGAVFDIAVDLRQNSPTYLQWAGVELTAENRRAYHIPEGFAHGFQTLTDDVEMLYFHSAPYVPDAEGGLNALDPLLNISWPLPAGNMSDRDKALPRANEFTGLTL